MGIRVICPDCDAAFLVKEKYAGATRRCVECGGRIRVPQKDLPTEAAIDLPSRTSFRRAMKADAFAPPPSEDRIRFACSNCGRRIKVKDKDAGRQFPCPDCGAQLRVPPSTPPLPTRAMAVAPIPDVEPPSPAPRPKPHPPAHDANPLTSMPPDELEPEPLRPVRHTLPPVEKRRQRTNGNLTLILLLGGGAVAIVALFIFAATNFDLANVGLNAFYSTSMPPGSRNDVSESPTDLDILQQMTAELERSLTAMRSIHDVDTARRHAPQYASGFVNCVQLSESAATVESTPVDEHNARLLRRFEVLGKEFVEEDARLATIPGVTEILARASIDAGLTRQQVERMLNGPRKQLPPLP